MSPSPARRARGGATPAASTPAVQIELFPERPVIDVLDPRAHVGPRTGVLALVRVRVRASEAPHLIFHDRHGWYCEAHGPTCVAVGIAREAAT